MRAGTKTPRKAGGRSRDKKSPKELAGTTADAQSTSTSDPPNSSSASYALESSSTSARIALRIAQTHAARGAAWMAFGNKEFLDESKNEVKDILAYAPVLIGIQHAKPIDPTMETIGALAVIWVALIAIKHGIASRFRHSIAWETRERTRTESRGHGWTGPRRSTPWYFETLIRILVIYVRVIGITIVATLTRSIAANYTENLTLWTATVIAVTVGFGVIFDRRTSNNAPRYRHSGPRSRGRAQEGHRPQWTVLVDTNDIRTRQRKRK